jgi:hypothetical protein
MEEENDSECIDDSADKTGLPFKVMQTYANLKKSVSNLSASEFLLLSSLGAHSDFMDKLLQELVKYHGKKTIEFIGSKN